jgi:hypothetical protein
MMTTKHALGTAIAVRSGMSRRFRTPRARIMGLCYSDSTPKAELGQGQGLPSDGLVLPRRAKGIEHGRFRH